MKIEINDYRKVHAIQEEFTAQYPRLKIQFHGKPSKPGGAPSDKINVSGSSSIGECRTIHDTGRVTITPMMTIAELESSFSDVYGLTIEVLLRAGEGWVTAAHKNDWTLEEQSNGKSV